MSGPEIAFGIAGLVGAGVAPAIETAIRRMRKNAYKYQYQRDEVHSRFIEAWQLLQTNVAKINQVLPCINSDRVVLRELQKATKVFQETNTHLLECVPLSSALRDAEKTELLLSLVTQKLEGKTLASGVASGVEGVSPRPAGNDRRYNLSSSSLNTSPIPLRDHGAVRMEQQSNIGHCGSSGSGIQYIIVQTFEDERSCEIPGSPLAYVSETVTTIRRGPSQHNTSCRSTHRLNTNHSHHNYNHHSYRHPSAKGDFHGSELAELDSSTRVPLRSAGESAHYDGHRRPRK